MNRKTKQRPIFFTFFQFFPKGFLYFFETMKVLRGRPADPATVDRPTELTAEKMTAELTAKNRPTELTAKSHVTKHMWKNDFCHECFFVFFICRKRYSEKDRFRETKECFKDIPKGDTPLFIRNNDLLWKHGVLTTLEGGYLLSAQ